MSATITAMTSASEKAIAVSGIVAVSPGSRICQNESIKSSASEEFMSEKGAKGKGMRRLPSKRDGVKTSGASR